MPHQPRRSAPGQDQGPNPGPDARRSVTATDPSARHRRPVAVRRHSPVSAQKLGRSHRERERQESWDDERESFPQFCMTCEKQFVPHDQRFLYCSETCRRIDQSQAAASTPTQPQLQLRSYAGGFHDALRAAGRSPEPARDIVPRAAPSRPTSLHLSSSGSRSPPPSPGSHRSSAISALRSLSLGTSSPPSPTGSATGALWPFGRSAATSPAASASSYTYSRPSAPYLSSAADGLYTLDAGLDRPLPPRHPGAYARPKSIELVTPIVGR